MGFFSKVVNNPAVQQAIKGTKPAVTSGGGGTTITRSPGRGFFGKLRSRLGLKEGGKVSSKSASARADGCAQRGKTRGKMV